MSAIQVAYANILETAPTVTVTSQATGFPAYRLMDRRLGVRYAAATTDVQTIAITQDAGAILPANALVIAGHNLAGCAIKWQYNLSGTWTSAATTWTQADNALILKTSASPISYTQWRVQISGATVAPEIAELWLTRLYTLTASPNQPKYAREPAFTRNEPPSGVVQFIVNGQMRTAWDYSFLRVGPTDKAVFEALRDAAHGRPCFLVDHSGRAAFAEILGRVEFADLGVNRSSVSIKLQEVI